MTVLDVGTEYLPERETAVGTPPAPQPGTGEEREGFLFDEQPPAPPDLSQARLLMTEPRPAGFGEVLVTEVWAASPPKEREPGAAERAALPYPQARADQHIEQEISSFPSVQKEEKVRKAREEPPDRHKQWENRQELRELGLLRERPLVSYDARFEEYWRRAKEAMASAPNAIVDPYTEFAASFADADLSGIREHREAAQEYGRAGDSLLKVGRAYVVIGRHKSARSMLEAAAKSEPQHRDIWYNLGVARLLGRANKPAREALERAADQAPGDFRSELALGMACYHLRDYAAAEEQFGRLAGPTGLRATARSLLACSHRMQGKWDDARVELSFLKDARPGDWAALAQQCADCVERGEQKRAGPMRARRQSAQMWKALAATGAGGIWLAYGMAQDLFRKEAQWALVPLFVLALLLARTLRRISGRELPGEFGSAEQGLPCWQSTSWVRPRRSEF